MFSVIIIEKNHTFYSTNFRQNLIIKGKSTFKFKRILEIIEKQNQSHLSVSDYLNVEGNIQIGQNHKNEFLQNVGNQAQQSPNYHRTRTFRSKLQSSTYYSIRQK